MVWSYLILTCYQMSSLCFTSTSKAQNSRPSLYPFFLMASTGSNHFSSSSLSMRKYSRKRYTSVIWAAVTSKYSFYRTNTLLCSIRRSNLLEGWRWLTKFWKASWRCHRKKAAGPLSTWLAGCRSLSWECRSVASTTHCARCNRYRPQRWRRKCGGPVVSYKELK